MNLLFRNFDLLPFGENKPLDYENDDKDNNYPCKQLH